MLLNDADADGDDAGTTFLCSVLIAPVKNENNDVILFILNLEDITDAPVKTDVQRQTPRKLGTINVHHTVSYMGVRARARAAAPPSRANYFFRD